MPVDPLEEKPDPRSSRAGLALLRNANFARLFAARLVSAFGTAMVFVALPFGVLELVGSDNPGPVGYVIASASGAQLLFQLFGGALADRGSRQRMMVSADLLAMSAQGAMAVLLVSGYATVPLLMGLAVLIGISFALHWPAGVGLVPLVVERNDLQAANALLSMANSTAFGLGAAVGGIVASTVGAHWALGADALTFGLSAYWIAGLRTGQQQRAETTSLLRDVRDGWREFVAHRWLWAIVAQFSILVMGFQATYAVIGPIVADRSMGGPSDWGWISAGFGAGLLCGGLLAMRLQISRPMLTGVICCLALALLPYLLIEPAPVAWIAAGGFAAGAGIELFAVLWNTSLHTHVAPEALSRVSAYDVVGSMAFAPIGEALAGPLVASVGAPLTLQWATALVIVPTLLVLAVPEVRQLRSGPPDRTRRIGL